mgnify:CR=1 FL=1
MKIIIILLMATLSACGWFKPSGDYNEKETIEAPPFFQLEDGRVVYDYYDEINDFGLTTGETREVCEAEEYDRTVPPELIESGVIKFAYKTFEFDNESLEFSQFTDEEIVKLFEADHIHINKAQVIVVSGAPDFTFVDWFEVYLEDNLVFWGGPFEEDEFVVDLKYDGSIDLRLYITEAGIPFSANLRAKVPPVKTYVSVEVSLLRLFNCVLESI